MGKNSEIVYLRGKLHWAKILGNPQPNYLKDANEWTMDLSLDKDGVAQVKKLQLGGRVKDKKDDRGQFISFKQRELRKDGSPAKPITVIDSSGKPWDQSEKIGNGTVADVKFEVVDYGMGPDKMGVYPRAVRILDHVPYEGSDFGAISSDDEYFKTPSKSEVSDEQFGNDFGHLEDDAL